MQPPAAAMQGENSSKTRNAEDEACARELLVLGGRESAKTTAAGSKKVHSNSKLTSPKKHHFQRTVAAPQSPGIATIVLDNSEIINGNDIDDTFTFITGDSETTGLSMVEPTLNSAILTTTSEVTKSGGQRIVMHVPPPVSSSSASSHHQTFAHALDGNLTDAESSDEETEQVAEKKPKEASVASTGGVVQESSTSHSSESSSVVTNAITISSNSQVSTSGGLLDLSTPKLSDTSTEDVDENQPIDYSKKTLSISSSSSSNSSSNNTSSSSLVSPTSLASKPKPPASGSSGSSSCKILSVESLLSRSPPRSLQHQSTTQLESASKTPYHPEVTTSPEDKKKSEKTEVRIIQLFVCVSVGFDRES